MYLDQPLFVPKLGCLGTANRRQKPSPYAASSYGKNQARCRYVSGDSPETCPGNALAKVPFLLVNG